MIQYFRKFSLVKSEVESHSCSKADNSNHDHQERHVTMTVGIKWIITEFITIRLVVSVGLINDQLGMRVRGENVLVMEHRFIIKMSKFIVHCNNLIGSSVKVAKGN